MKSLSVFKSLVLALLLAASFPSEACTGLKLKTKDGQNVRGRTFEFGIKVDISAVVVPKGYPFIATTPLGSGLTYQGKYAAAGTICFDNMLIMDGMNEKGLSVGTFYFPGFAGYTQTTRENQSRSLSPIDFPNWLLTQFASLDEVRAALKDIVIAPTVIKQWGDTPPPFHYIVYDRAGNSIAIEPVNGQFNVYDNPLGTFTNSPSFDWHMTNLRNFINLTPLNVAPLKIDGLVLAPFGQGSGMVGLPGDFTPPSRFVRAAIFSITATPLANAQEAVFQAFHILNQFDIPVGAISQPVKGIVYDDYTLATTVHDPVNLKYYFKTFEDQTIKAVDLKAFDPSARDIKAVKASGKQPYIDISKELKPIPRA